MEYCKKLSEVPGHSPEGHQNTVNRTLIDEHTGIRGFILIHGEVFPGGGAEAHRHSFEQGFYVLSGRAKVAIGSREYAVEAGSAYWAPAGVEHRIDVLGSEPLRVLRIDARRKD